MLETLINHGADVNAQTHSLETPLHLASRRAHFDVVKMLLKHGANPAKLTKRGHSPLHYSVTATATYDDIDETSAVTTSTQLIEYERELINMVNHRGQAPLHLAIKKNAFDQVKVILVMTGSSSGVTNARDHNGNTPLHYAAQAEDSDKLVAALIDAGADVSLANRRRVTPLHLAAQYSDKHTVTRMLTTDGAMPTLDGAGRNVLYYAAMGGNRQSFELLRQLDTNQLSHRSDDDKSLLHIAAQSHLPNMIEHIIQLIPSVIDHKDKNGRTALHLAATNSRYLRLRRQIEASRVYIDEAELMRKKGSELELVANRSAKCCEILLNHEADATLRDNHVCLFFLIYSFKTIEIGFTCPSLCGSVQQHFFILCSSQPLFFHQSNTTTTSNNSNNYNNDAA